jgi:hypothetical protein
MTAKTLCERYSSRNQSDDTTEIIALNWTSSPLGLDVQVSGLSKAPPVATFVLPPVSLAAFAIPDSGKATALVYGEAQRAAAAGPSPLATGAVAGAASVDAGAGAVSGAGRLPRTGCRPADAAVVCSQVVLPAPAITTMGMMSGSGLTFGSTGSAWGSYAYAGTGQTAPTATLTADGNGLEITGGFVPPVSAAGNFEGYGLYFASSSCIDASSYTGVVFDFSGELGGCHLLAGISFSGDDSSASDPVRGACPGTTSQCYGPSADVTTAALAATASSPTIRIPFTSFVGGMPNSMADPSSIVGVQWALTAPAGSSDGGGCQAIFQVENVAFY